MVFQVSLDFVSCLINRDSLIVEDALCFDSGPSGKETEYGQTKDDDFLAYFVIPNLLPGVNVRGRVSGSRIRPSESPSLKNKSKR